MIAITALLLFGLLQLSQLLAAREVLAHAANCGARAQTVGFNRWMVRKVVDAASIPNAGRMLVPPYENVNPALRAYVSSARPGATWDFALQAQPASEQAAIELARIPDYLAAENEARARFILDYAYWEGEHAIGYWSVNAPEVPGGDPTQTGVLHLETYQRYPLWVPMHRAFYGADTVALAGDAYLENHYPLYLDDMHW